MDDQIFARRRLLSTLENVVSVATRGVPAVRAALYGARLGAGARLDNAVVERLGLRVVASLSNNAPALGPVVATGAAQATRSMAVTTKDGIAVGLGGAARLGAAVTENAVALARNLTVRGALLGIGRAASRGAAVGALVDGAFGAVEAGVAVYQGRMTRTEALTLTGQRVARGAASGAASVAAAGAVSAVIAATGISVAGAPVVVPLAAMLAAGTYVSRKVDDYFGAGETSEWRLPRE